jgi:hypothetical protein
MPSTGSSTEVTNAAAPTKSPKLIGWSCTVVTASTMPSTTKVSRPIVSSSHIPARVS